MKLAPRILKALELQPMTTAQLAKCLYSSYHAVWRALLVLLARGDIRKSARLHGRYGAPATVWVLR